MPESPQTPAAAVGFGEVRHRRLRPSAHAFSCASYFMRLPIRDLAGAFAPLRLMSHNRWNLLGFYDRDHGARDGGSLVGWIDGLLAAQGIHDASGPIWLHTFPRVFGYVFNPVSFWFCHRADGALRAVVCEVNNTFGESHCYLLDHASGAPLRSGEELCASKVLFVSPFCRVEGQYRFRFLQTNGRAVARIDYDDASGPLLVTSISGTLRPLADRTLLQALVRFPMFTFGVIARIHWQALKLWAKRVPFISKPANSAAEATQ